MDAFDPMGPIAADPDTGRTAIERLRRSEESPTATIFDVASLVADSPLAITEVLTAYAREESQYCGTVPPTLRAELERLCTAAREQGHDVALSTISQGATPSTRPQALAVARRITQSRSLTPQQQRERLESFLSAATDAGIDVSRDDFGDFRAGSSSPTVTAQALDRETLAEPDGGPDEMAVDPGGHVDDSPPVAVDGGKTTAEDGRDDDVADSQREAHTERDTRGDEQTEPADETERTAEENGSGSVSQSDDSSEPPIDDAEFDEDTQGGGIPTRSDGASSASDDSTGGVSEATEGEDGSDEALPAEESGFVFPAAETDDDVDESLRPTVKTDDSASDEREGTAALITESDGGAVSPAIDGLDVIANDNVPAVRIVKGGGSSEECPDPRTLTATLSKASADLGSALTAPEAVFGTSDGEESDVPEQRA